MEIYQMKKNYILEDLDCAVCAAKVEKEVAKIDGVLSSKVTFMTQSMTLEFEDSKAEEAEKAMLKLVEKLEPDVTVRKR